MNVVSTQFTLATKSFEIYVSGCSGNPHCRGCHNPELWDFNLGERFTSDYFNKIKSTIEDFDDLIENIMIFGGEPLDQNIIELRYMLTCLKTLNKKIWLFTRFDYCEVEEMDFSRDILESIDYIKCGRYVPELTCDNNVQYGIKLATSNQKIYKVGET